MTETRADIPHSFTIRTVKDDATGESVTTIDMDGETLKGVQGYTVNSFGEHPTEISITFAVDSLDITEGPHFSKRA